MVQVPEHLLNVSLSPEQREVLGKGQETELIAGFTSKKGNKFSAYLKINEAGDLKFRFPDKDIQEIPVEFLGVKLSGEHREQLKNGKETTLIEGLKGRRGIPFSGFLSIGEEGKIKIRFPVRGSVDQHSGITVHTPLFLNNNTMSVPELTKVEANQKADQPNTFDQPHVQVLPNQAGVNLQDQPNAFDQPPGSKMTINTDTPISKPIPVNLSRSADLSDIEIYGRKISPAEVDQLVSTGKTPLLDGFKTGSGKIFSAKLDYTNQKLSIHIPQRCINTGISMLPKKYLVSK